MHLAAARNWGFTFNHEAIPLSVVFNSAMYAPPLLFAAQDELQRRRIPADLGLRLEGEANSLFGARAGFIDTDDQILAQFWRIAASVHILACLPQHQGNLQLDPLQFVLGDRFAEFLPASPIAEGQQ